MEMSFFPLKKFPQVLLILPNFRFCNHGVRNHGWSMRSIWRGHVALGSVWSSSRCHLDGKTMGNRGVLAHQTCQSGGIPSRARPFWSHFRADPSQSCLVNPIPYETLPMESPTQDNGSESPIYYILNNGFWWMFNMLGMGKFWAILMSSLLVTLLICSNPTKLLTTSAFL